MCLGDSEAVMLLGAVPSADRPEWSVPLGCIGGVSHPWGAFAVRVVCPRRVCPQPELPSPAQARLVVCPRRFTPALWCVPAGSRRPV